LLTATGNKFSTEVFSGVKPLEKDFNSSSPKLVLPLFLNKEQKSEKDRDSLLPIGVKKS